MNSRGRAGLSQIFDFSIAILEAVPAVRIFHFQDGGDVTNPAGLSPCVLPQTCKSGPMHPSWAKHWRQKLANPALFPRMYPGSPNRPTPPPAPSPPPPMAADKCINVRNFLTAITITLSYPYDGNKGIALPPVFHIFHFMLQNLRSTNEMLPGGWIYKSKVKSSDEEDSVSEVWYL